MTKWRTSYGGHRPADIRNFNGANGIRTRDLLLAKQALSQLSYGPSHAVSDSEKYRILARSIPFRPNPV